ncbi:hypothetical protein [Hyphomicrobium sp.]|uniref:hypothetical protein n=1 Tax=Hyphomicrobium sp. TaxID=82 RepID=UPI002C68987D|nr:hypothetical protein [Hyphomicrobium sp.]HRN89259.1 hypothetical protein [Hyphomicrobium sp.]HRQ26988.1 hypothetical protein [Hyphomicrobium sp.]
MDFWKTLVSTLSRDQAPEKGKTDRQSLEPSQFRRSPRMREGFLWADGLIMPRPCTIRDLSPLTAEVVLWHDDIKPALLRGSLKLYSSADRREADCTLAGRRDNILSLKLQSAFHAPSRAYP